MSQNKVKLYDVGDSEVGQRIDNFFFKTLKGIPKSRIYRAIRKGEIRVNSKRVKAEYKLVMHDKIRIPPIRVPASDDEDLVLGAFIAASCISEVLYEDKDFLIINKAAGFPVHAGTGNKVGVIEALRINRVSNTYLELGHRLDRDTSGCLVLCKNRNSLLDFHAALQNSGVKKIYRCLVAGSWSEQISSCELPLIRASGEISSQKTIVSDLGKKAISYFSLKQKGVGWSLLEVEIATGRMHQIRAHLAALGFPIIGDKQYGWQQEKFPLFKTKPRVMLHSHRLEFYSSAQGCKIVSEAKLPEDFRKCMKVLKNMTV
ncbi:MAG: RluA family pseudouridine synthase [Pseudomonadota bacterium]|nr:RluA family pseudouridine synthase [Pseudomonadota bacterium]